MLENEAKKSKYDIFYINAEQDFMPTGSLSVPDQYVLSWCLEHLSKFSGCS